MQRIRLTKNKFAVVDDEDFGFLNQWKWHYTVKGYAVRWTSRKDLDGRKLVWMHREILKTPQNKQTDHINGNKIDNRRKNLRVCSNTENSFNKIKQSNNTSGYKGVSWRSKDQKWAAQIQFQNKFHWLGLFNLKESAALAYKNKAYELSSDFARAC